MQNARLDESQAEIKTAGRNINNLRYADDTTLMAESERGEWQSWLKAQIKKTKIMASSPITSWQIDEETDRLYFGRRGSKITAGGDCSHEIKRHSLEEKPWAN